MSKEGYTNYMTDIIYKYSYRKRSQTEDRGVEFLKWIFNKVLPAYDPEV